MSVGAWSSVLAAALALSVEGDVDSFTVCDDGVGFDPDAHAQGFGLLGLRERLRAVDGTLSLDTRPGRGTRVHAALRVAPDHPVELS